MYEHWIEEKQVEERVRQRTSGLQTRLEIERADNDWYRAAVRNSQELERRTYSMLEEAMRWLAYGQQRCADLTEDRKAAGDRANLFEKDAGYWRQQLEHSNSRHRATLARAAALEAQVQELRAQKAEALAQLATERQNAEQRLAAKDAELKRVQASIALRTIPGTADGHAHLAQRLDDLADKAQRMAIKLSAQEDTIRYLDEKVEEHEKALYEADPDDGEGDVEEPEVPPQTDRLDEIEASASRAINLANRAHKRLNFVDERLDELEEAT